MSHSQVILRGNVNTDQYVYSLQSAYRANIRLYDPDYAIARDPAFKTKAMRDPIVQQALDIRLNMVAGKNWTVEPRSASANDDDKGAAAVMEDLILQWDAFSQARKRLGAAVMNARSYEFVEGRREAFAAGPESIEADWWFPTKSKNIDEARIRWRSIPTDDGEVRTVQEIAPILPSPELWVQLDTFQLIQVIFNDEEGRLGYGRGLREAIYHYYWAKGVVMREGLQGLERWAQGLPILKIDSSRHGGTEQDMESVRTEMLEAIRRHRAEYGGIAIDINDELTIEEPGQGGSKMVNDWREYLDGSITRLVTGSLLPSGGGANVGSNARSQTEENSTESLVQFDRGVVDASLTRDLIYLIWEVNRENFTRFFPKARMPVFRTVNEKREDPEVAARVIETLNRAGVAMKLDEIYKKTGLTKPDPGDDILEPQDPMLAGAGGGFGGGNRGGGFETRPMERSAE